MSARDVTAKTLEDEDDMRDGMLFRLWVRAASYPGGWPSRLAHLIQEETVKDKHVTPAAYRRALMLVPVDTHRAKPSSKILPRRHLATGETING